MNPIQVVLTLGAGFLLVLYLRRLRTVIRDRVIALVLFLLVVLAILFPGITSLVAGVLGVGRGTDLVLYLLALVVGFFAILLNSRLLKIEDRHTILVQYIALNTARRSPFDGDPPE